MRFREQGMLTGGEVVGAAATVGVVDAERSLQRSVLTRREVTYCLGRTHPLQHVAGRVAAKRAVVTLLARVGRGSFGPRQIEVVPMSPLFPVALAFDLSRRPQCRASDGDPRVDRALRSVRISISHDGPVAVAAALLTTQDDGSVGHD